MKHIFCIFILLILLSSFSYSEELTCQYKDIDVYEVIEERYYKADQLLEGKPEIVETQTSIDPSWARFKVYNPFDFEIQVFITYTKRSKWYGDQAHSASGTVPSKEYKILQGGFGPGSLSDLKFNIIKPEDLFSKIENVIKEKKVCKLCNGEVCLDDGEPCSKDNECGGNFCVQNVCTISTVCYKKDCKCSKDEVQCEDNTKCVKRESIGIGSKPICSFEECNTKYINPDTGLCAKSPEQILQEEQKKNEENKKRIQNIIIIVSILFTIAIFIALYFGVQRIKARTKLKEKEIEIIKEKSKLATREIKSKYKTIETIKSSITELRKNIKELENLKDKQSDEKKLLNDLQEDLENKKTELQKTRSEIEKLSEEGWNSIKPFPYELVGHRLVIPNPFLGGYLCFYDKDLALNEYPTSKLVHRWIWKKFHGRWLKAGYHIHHKDGDKFNNDINNLEEIEGVEHYIFHKKNI